jgi:tRNA(fMet)-specific endonuclease VapC
MAMEYVLDTNTIIHLLRGTKSVEMNVERVKSNGARFIIPPYVDYEVRRGLIIRKIPRHEKAYALICDNCSLEPMTGETWQRAAHIYAELYVKYKTVKDSDIIIAAFCLVNGYTLVTSNTKDFEHIDGLELADWVE